MRDLSKIHRLERRLRSLSRWLLDEMNIEVDNRSLSFPGCWVGAFEDLVVIPHPTPLAEA